MLIQKARQNLLQQLSQIYSVNEAGQITDWVLEFITGMSKTDQLVESQYQLSQQGFMQLEKITSRLMQHEPVQYVLEESWFCGLKFYVNKHVLIPRPETEELVEWIIKTLADQKDTFQKITILDIGTGSGCIPICLAKKLQHAAIWSCDISKEALQVAEKNASAHAVKVKLLPVNFLDEKQWHSFPKFDIIVSNPPYVPEKDKASMQANVVNFEPGKALFVPDNDALVFYNAIAKFSSKHLQQKRIVFLETHESLSREVAAVFQSNGFTTTVKKDMQGKNRMVKAEK